MGALKNQSNEAHKPIQDKVSETLLIPLFYRHCENLRTKSGKKVILADSLASELVAQIPYDYARFASARFSRVGSVARARYFDEKVAKFITNNENAVVILGGCGLDTRYNRLLQRYKESEIPNFNSVKFYEIDLPEVIALRQKLLKESPQDKFLACSLLDNAWVKELQTAHKNSPFIIVIEGVVMYFTSEEIATMFENFGILGECELWFDVLGSLFAKNKIKHDALKNTNAEIKSYADSEEDIVAFGKNQVNVTIIERTFYAHEIKFRCGIPGFLVGLLPKKWQSKMGSLCGVKITKNKNF